jgi:hypothetical protein
MGMNKELMIKTPKGTGVIEKIYKSELGYLMLRIDNLDGSYTTYNLGNYDPDNNIFTTIINNENTGPTRD